MKPILIGCSIVFASSLSPAFAQVGVRGHVFLPRTEGATVLSTHINAAANRLVALGDFMESAAIARQINLESDRIAMENSLLWVETYFERRKMNREYRDEARIDYKESQQIRMQERHHRIDSRDMSDDLVGDLNYMLAALIRDQNAYAAIFLGAEPHMTAIDQSLGPNEVTQIILEETSGPEGATRIRLSNPQLIRGHLARSTKTRRIQCNPTEVRRSPRKCDCGDSERPFDARHLRAAQPDLERTWNRFSMKFTNGHP